jgi:3-deoxy-7-phosphoheptulonate synthase
MAPGCLAPQPMRMMHAYRHSSQVMAPLRQLGKYGLPAVWASHEALLLDYEEALTCRGSTRNEWILGSTHLPWIGIRTSAVEGAHVELLSGVANPVGCKISADSTSGEIVDLCARVDPGRQPGRLVLISRMGADAVTDRLPGLVRSVMAAEHHPVWLCDPMHANTASPSVRPCGWSLSAVAQARRGSG